ncbi:MAG: glycosyltransferase family 2 protein [Leptolyngbyaceae cyanobacterium]
MASVSIVIPTYNAEKTIADTVGAVLAQTFSDFEVIVINDGSTDATLEHLETYTDPRLQIFSFENAGPQKSRNRGLEKATGEFISFIDADDMWTADKLELQLAALKNNPQASVVYSWTDVVDETGEFYRRGGYATKTGDVFLDLLLANFVENGSNFLAYTAAVASIGGFDEAIVAGQDLDIVLSLSRQYLFTVVPKVQVLYRKSKKDESWSSSIKRARTGIDQVLDKHLLNHAELKDYHHLCVGNLYKYLVFECLSNTPSRAKGWYSLQLLWVAIANDRELLKTGVFVKICLRIMTTIFLPQSLSRHVIEHYPALLDITSIYGYLKLKRS